MESFRILLFGIKTYECGDKMDNLLERIKIKLLQVVKHRFFKIAYLGRKNGNYFDLLCLLPGGTNRLPNSVTMKLPKGISANSKFSAGKNICFKTNASRLSLKILFKEKRVFCHMSNMATSGLDIYVKENDEYIWKTCVSAKANTQMSVCENIILGEGVKEVLIYLPAFAQIDSLFLKLEENAYIEPGGNKKRKMLAVYGSSISQGCAASRPALSYANLLSRNLKCELLNFGFSESAKGEAVLIEYITKFNIDIFIVEYDHNVSVNELKSTHKNVYEIIRENSDCFIVLMSRFSGGLSISFDEEEERMEVIKDTYMHAIEAGDEKIAMIDGRGVFGMNKSDYFVDGIHPNDAGMRIIADEIQRIIKERGVLI